MSNTTTAAQHEAAKAARYARLIAKLGKMSAAQIKSEITKMHDKARSLPERDAWETNQLHMMANGAANHFFLIINPEMAHGANLQHAVEQGFPIPNFA